MTNTTEEIMQQNARLAHLKAINERKEKEVKQIKEEKDMNYNTEIDKLNELVNSCSKKINALESNLHRPHYKQNIANDNYSEKHLAFLDYVKKGDASHLINSVNKSLSTGESKEGGYLVAPEVSYRIFQSIHETSVMRKLANTITISSNKLELLEDANEANNIGWVYETSPRYDTNTPKITKKVIPVYEMYAQPKASQRILDDAAIDIEKWLAGKLIDNFSSAENHAFLYGDGKIMPQGILSYNDNITDKDASAIEVLNTLEDNKITSDDLLNLLFSLKENYAANAAFLMNRSTLHKIRLLKTQEGEYIWSPNLSSGPDTIFGIPVYQVNDMPSYNLGGTVIALGDFKAAYQIVDRKEISILRDPFTEKPFVKFYATKRVGGDVILPEAIKLLLFWKLRVRRR